MWEKSEIELELTENLLEWLRVLQEHNAENLPYIGYSKAEIVEELETR